MAKETKFFNIMTSEDTATLLLYGDVGVNDTVDSGRIVGELLSLQARYQKIEVRINSRGGDVFSGMAIYNALRQARADITIYIDGLAASIAAIIALCGKPLYMSPYAKLMLHSVSGGIYGNASELRATAEQMEKLQSSLAEMIAARCEMTPAEVLAQYFDEKDHWLSAQEALDMHLIDGIYELPDGDSPETDNENDIYQYFTNRLHNGAQNQNEMALLDNIKALPSFKDMADEGAVLAHIKTLENKAAKADALEQANKAYEQKIATLEAQEIGNFLDKAISEGKITQEQKATYQALMTSDRENTEALINSMKPHVQRRAVDFVNEDGKAGNFENKTWDQLDKENRLADLKNQNPELFRSKYKERFGVEYKD
ncbi:MAG: ATP-dependent Clp protease proteolytic subunit [Prevotella sp.]|nr:ATP-dependent Clp protease proteolytic subunit [Prevotella sp.]